MSSDVSKNSNAGAVGEIPWGGCRTMPISFKTESNLINRTLMTLQGKKIQK